MASDWRLSGIFRAYSGSPLSVTVTGDPARTGIGGQRANQVLDDPYGERHAEHYLNRAAFASPAVGTMGNMERNSVYGPGTHLIDLSLVRSFRFNGNHRIEARIESFNALNWFQWNNPHEQLQQRAVRPHHVGRRSAHHAVRDQVPVLASRGAIALTFVGAIASPCRCELSDAGRCDAPPLVGATLSHVCRCDASDARRCDSLIACRCDPSLSVRGPACQSIPRACRCFVVRPASADTPDRFDLEIDS